MKITERNRGLAWATVLALLAFTRSPTIADDNLDAIKTRLADLEQQNQAMKARLSEMEINANENWLSAARAEQIKGIVRDVLADAKSHESSPNGYGVGYNNGFFIQSDDKNFKLSIGGVLQVRYEMALHHANNAAFISKPLPQGDNENSSGFDIRRARLNFTGTAFSPNLFYRFEGDFFGNATGGFTVTDAYVGYAFSDKIKVRAGAFKTPFTKSEQEYDANLELERPEVNFPFDAQRSLGVSLFGDIIKDKFSYELNANDGSKSNTFRFVDSSSNVTTISSTTTPSYNLDNRLAFYGRLQYAGAGTIKEFYDGGEADLRSDTRPFIWMLGFAGGYESQNSGAAAFPQNSLSVVGLGTTNAQGFAKAYALNGDIFRATLDWSAKWQGLSVNTAAYFQQVNANPFAGSAGAGLPFNTQKTSFFEHGYYAQVGYMLIPRRLEVLGRAGFLLDEGAPTVGQFYTLGVNYYLNGNNAKVLLDINYSPQAAYTDASTLQIANTREVVARIQLQLKF
ncbi:MAG TPA: porin [Phycisphaerae bacterium]